MPVTVDGFVDHHAHLLATVAGGPPPWRSRADVRRFHERCAAQGRAPMDLVEPPAHDGLIARVQAALVSAASAGLCELWEAGLRDWAYLDALLALREDGPLPVRVRLLAAVGLAERGMRPRTGDPWCEVAGVKLYADGWLGPRTCAVSHPFCDEPGNTGLAFETAESLAARVAPLADAGWQVATHAIGDRAIEAVLDAYERVYGDDCATAAPRIEHAQLLRDDLVARMASLGVVACVQPGFGADDFDDAGTALGDGWPDAYRWSRLLDGGVRVVCGSDHPIDALAPLPGLAKLVGNPFEPMDAHVALSLMTSGAAGTTTLGEDPREVPTAHIADVAVLATAPSGT